MTREEMSQAESISTDGLMKEHSVGFALKWISRLGDERSQALTVKSGSIFDASTRVVPREL